MASARGTRAATAAAGTVAATMVATAAAITRPNMAKYQPPTAPSPIIADQLRLCSTSPKAKRRLHFASETARGSAWRKHRPIDAFRVIIRNAQSAQIAATSGATQKQAAPASAIANKPSGMPAPTRYWA